MKRIIKVMIGILLIMGILGFLDEHGESHEHVEAPPFVIVHSYRLQDGHILQVAEVLSC